VNSPMNNGKGEKSAMDGAGRGADAANRILAQLRGISGKSAQVIGE
jgi:hypothetical protein